MHGSVASWNSRPDSYFRSRYMHGRSASSCVASDASSVALPAPVPHGSFVQRGQHSPGASGNGLSHVSAGQVNGQQSTSPYWEHTCRKSVIIISPEHATQHSPNIHRSGSDRSTSRRCGTPRAAAPDGGTTRSGRTANSRRPARDRYGTENSCTAAVRTSLRRGGTCKRDTDR